MLNNKLSKKNLTASVIFLLCITLFIVNFVYVLFGYAIIRDIVVFLSNLSVKALDYSELDTTNVDLLLIATQLSMISFIYFVFYVF